MKFLRKLLQRFRRKHAGTYWQNRFHCPCGWTSNLVVWKAGTELSCPRCGSKLEQ